MTHKYKIINIDLKILYANTFWERFKGLLFYKSPIMEEGLLITRCNSIHMFFMKFPVDAVFLDQTNTVVKVAENLKPWSFISPVRHAHSTLELPSETIKKWNICVGDTINL